VLGGWNMQVPAATGDAQRLPKGSSDEDALERVALELLHPLTVIRLNAEELLQQFQAGQEDPATVDAAQALLRSVERMSHIVQVLRRDDPAASSAVAQR
jgi:signal transduction histidine kinase